MKYSVTIPVYKKKFFKECLESVLSQTYKDFEVIILNDKSPEAIVDIVSLYKDPRIRYYENETNVGAVNIVDNWNKLLSLAKGDYLICMGDDDKLAPNCLEKYNELMCRYPHLDIYHARTMMIDEKSNFCDIQEDRPSYESVYSMLWHRTFCYRIQFIGDFLFKVDSLRKKNGFYNLPLAWESDCITTFVNAKEKGIANGHVPTFYYRKNRYSITNAKMVQLKMDATILYEKWLSSFLKTKASNQIDERYRILLKQNASARILHNKVYMIADDLSYNFFKDIFFWFIARHKYGIPLGRLLFAVVLALGIKSSR